MQHNMQKRFTYCHVLLLFATNCCTLASHYSSSLSELAGRL